MALFTPTQLAELRQLSTGMLGHVRKAALGQPVPAGVFGNQMRQLQTDYGIRGAASVIRAWLDAVIDACPDADRGGIHALRWANETGTDYVDPATMTEDYRWAGRALIARFSDDQVALYQLIDGIPLGVVGIYLLRVAELCAGLLNAYEWPETAPGPVRVGDVITIRMPAGTRR